MKPRSKLAQTRLENKITRIYYQRCSGIAIPIMKMGEIIRVGVAAADAGKTDEEVGDALRAHAEKIRPF